MFDIEEYKNIQIKANNQHDPGGYEVSYLLWAGVHALPPTGKILDIGCGHGNILKSLTKSNYRNLYGLELNPDKITELRKWDTKCRVNIINDDMHNLTNYYDEGSFDFIISTHTLEHAYDPLAVLKEIQKILSPDGKFFVVLPYADRKKHAHVHVGSIDLKLDWDTAIANPDAAPTLDVMRQVGFLIEKHQVLIKEESVAKLMGVSCDPKVRQNELWVLLSKK